MVGKKLCISLEAMSPDNTANYSPTQQINASTLLCTLPLTPQDQPLIMASSLHPLLPLPLTPQDQPLITASSLHPLLPLPLTPQDQPLITA